MCPADKSPEGWKVLLDLLRKMPPEENLRRTLEHSEMIRLAGESGLRQAYPQASDREIFLRSARLRLGAELFCRVYGDELPDYGPAHRNS